MMQKKVIKANMEKHLTAKRNGYRNSTQQKQTTWCKNKVIKANMEKHLTAKHNGITHNWLCETDYRKLSLIVALLLFSSLS